MSLKKFKSRKERMFEIKTAEALRDIYQTQGYLAAVDYIDASCSPEVINAFYDIVDEQLMKKCDFFNRERIRVFSEGDEDTLNMYKNALIDIDTVYSDYKRRSMNEEEEEHAIQHNLNLYLDYIRERIHNGDSAFDAMVDYCWRHEDELANGTVSVIQYDIGLLLAVFTDSPELYEELNERFSGLPGYSEYLLNEEDE